MNFKSITISVEVEIEVEVILEVFVEFEVVNTKLKYASVPAYYLGKNAHQSVTTKKKNLAQGILIKYCDNFYTL